MRRFRKNSPSGYAPHDLLALRKLPQPENIIVPVSAGVQAQSVSRIFSRADLGGEGGETEAIRHIADWLPRSVAPQVSTERRRAPAGSLDAAGSHANGNYYLSKIMMISQFFNLSEVMDDEGIDNIALNQA